MPSCSEKFAFTEALQQLKADLQKSIKEASVNSSFQPIPLLEFYSFERSKLHVLEKLHQLRAGFCLVCLLVTAHNSKTSHWFSRRDN